MAGETPMSGGDSAGVKSFTCPACGGAVTLRAAGHSISAVCPYCSSVIDTANDTFRIIKQNHERNRPTEIPIGAKGILRGTKWEVIGYQSKVDMSQASHWDEYLLFNPYFGFSFLVQADHHWNLARVIRRDLGRGGADHEIEFEGEKFHIFWRSRCTVDYVKGEFYWRVRKGEAVNYFDYIAPPRMLSVEKSPQEVTVSVAEYLQREEVEQAFGLALPKREGIAANQPKPFGKEGSKMGGVALLAFFAAFIVQSNIGGTNQLLQSVQFHLDPANPVKSLSTPPFIVLSRSNVVVESRVPLQNNWMDLDLTLVNDASNDAYEAIQSVEYYSGYDGGEFWSEGAQGGETYFSAVRPATYRLVLEPTPGLLETQGIDVALAVRHKVPAWGNFWIIVVLMLAWPVWVVSYRAWFEHRRWANSDYTPAGQRNLDD